MSKFSSQRKRIKEETLSLNFRCCSSSAGVIFWQHDFIVSSCSIDFQLSVNQRRKGRRGYASVSPARGEGRGRGGFGPPPRMAARASQEQEREKAIAAVK